MKTLAEMADRLERLSHASFFGAIQRGTAALGLRLIADSFARSLTPNGQPWAPLKHRNGSPLVKTGAMRDSFTAYPLPNGVRFIAGVDYAGFHQNGTRTIPARRILPRTGEQLPAAWRTGIANLYTSAARRQVSS